MRSSTVRTTAAATALLASVGAGIATAPTAAAGETAKNPTKTSRMDIDGDGRRDTTTFRYTGVDKRGAHTYLLETRTARGQRATVRVVCEDGGEDIADVWWGAAGLDGTPGAEIVVNPAPVGDGTVLRAYRWSKGKLVPQTAPGRRAGRSGSDIWTLVNMPWKIEGMTFSTSRGVRYVTIHDLAPYRSTGKKSGTHTVYRWNKARASWTKVSTRRSGLLDDHYAQQKYAGVFGVQFR